MLGAFVIGGLTIRRTEIMDAVDTAAVSLVFKDKEDRARDGAQESSVEY
jgi:hypothetical protein